MASLPEPGYRHGAPARIGVLVMNLGTPEAPTLAMSKHQKTAGSDFLTHSEGTAELRATDDPDVTELAFVEILEAAGGGDADVIKGIQHHYDALVSVSHGGPVTACP